MANGPFRTGRQFRFAFAGRWPRLVEAALQAAGEQLPVAESILPKRAARRIIGGARVHPMKRAVHVSIAAVICATLSSCIVDRIPPRALTITRMEILKLRVLQYTQSHGQLPTGLSALAPREGYDNSLQDGWQRELVFEVSASDVVSFRSLGRDAAVGGSGEDADIVRSFPASDAHLRCRDATIEWSEDTTR